MTAIALLNPGFESGVSADAQAQATVGTPASVTIEGGSNARTGSYGMKWNPSLPSNGSLVFTPKAATQSTTYIPSQTGTHTFSIWARTNLVQGDHTFVLRLRAYNSSNTLLAEEVYTAPGSVPLTTTYAQFTVTQAPVAGTAYVQPLVEVVLTTDLNNGSFNFDDQSLDVVPQAAPPAANFTVSVSGSTATFTNTSTGSPTSYLWHFGDGETSTATSPTYDYDLPGNYVAVLEAANAGGTNAVGKAVLVAGTTLDTAKIAPFSSDTPTLLTRTMTHIARARLVMPDGETFELDLEDGRISWVETRAPRVVASLSCRVPTDQALLDRLDPRTGARLVVDAGYLRPGGVEDVQTVANLALRSRQVSRPDDVMALVAMSDESLVTDGSVAFGGTITAGTTLDAIAVVVRQVFPGLPFNYSGLTNSGPAINQSQVDTDRWDTVADLADRIDARVYDNGLRQWYVADAPVLTTPTLDLTVGENGTIVTSDAGLDRDTWANYVALRYVWTDSSNVRHRVTSTRKITSGPYAATTGNTRILLFEREVPATQAEADAAATALVKRTVTRGRSFSVSAISAYWLRPGHTINVTLPLGGTEQHLVSSVDFDLRTGLMDLTTRLPDNTGTIGA